MEFPRALLALLAIIALVPVISYFATSAPALTALNTRDQVLLVFVLPVVILLWLASWINPGGA